MRDRAEALPLALTCGDPAGIGIEIALAAWSKRDAPGIPPFFLIGEPALLHSRAKTVGINARIVEAEPEQAGSSYETALPVVSLKAIFEDRPGKPNPSNAPGIIGSIDRAVELVLAKRASAVVTLPIAKSVLYDAGFGFPGHTEYLAHLAARATGKAVKPVMMLAGPELRAVPVTIHIPIASVPGHLTSELIEETIGITDADLRSRFGIPHPRLAIAGLNPHAGEGGALGTEDDAIIRPAIERVRANGIDAIGPLPADTLFHARARAGYDAAICMYHDQALIPAKALAFDETVNVTLGLPFVRTSPDHGTAFDIAGKGIARPDSLVAALRLAARLAAQPA